MIYVHPIIRAAATVFGFVFIHPFEDGNGRIHRFLIHDILSRDSFMPAGMIIPMIHLSGLRIRTTDHFQKGEEKIFIC